MVVCTSKKTQTLIIKKFIFIFILIVTILYIYLSMNFNVRELLYVPKPLTSFTEHIKSVAANLVGNRNQSAEASIRYSSVGVGKTYKLVDIPEVEFQTSNGIRKKTHVILWYNNPYWINLNFASQALKDRCPYKNCEMTSSHGNVSDKSAIVFCLTQPLSVDPPKMNRPLNQVWIIFWMESPRKIDMLKVDRLGYRHVAWRNTMNWTMSYRTDSDIVFPYGSLTSVNVSSLKDYGEIYNRKQKFAAWVVSNCDAESRRSEYANEMTDYGIDIDIYGNCGEEKRWRNEHELKQMLSNKYKFYLAFENSICQDYVTEKFFRYVNLDIVLVVRGGANYSNLLPPKTFINTADFNSTYELVKYLKFVSNDRKTYTKCLKEKDKYVSTEMFGLSNSYCRLCEKLNHLEENRKVIPDIVDMLHDNQCEYPSDLNTFHTLTSYLTWSNMIILVALIMIMFSCYISIRKNR